MFSLTMCANNYDLNDTNWFHENADVISTMSFYNDSQCTFVASSKGKTLRKVEFHYKKEGKTVILKPEFGDEWELEFVNDTNFKFKRTSGSKIDCPGMSKREPKIGENTLTNSLKGKTFVTRNAKDAPSFFLIENVGVFEFVDDNSVGILFPYVLNIAGASRELMIPGEYERIENSITIRFKLNKDQESPAVLKLQVVDGGETLLGENGERFEKVIMPR